MTRGDHLAREIQAGRPRASISGNIFAAIDAQALPFADASFDRVLSIFGLLHLSDPERACAEAFRVLKPGGKFGFTVWAPPSKNRSAQIVNDAIEAHADPSIDLPQGPPYFLFAEEDACRDAMTRAGFHGRSMIFATHTAEWKIPTARYLFDAEREAGVRTAGLLARQSPEKLEAIREAIEKGVRQYASGDSFAIPNAAHVIVVTKP